MIDASLSFRLAASLLHSLWIGLLIAAGASSTLFGLWTRRALARWSPAHGRPAMETTTTS